MREVHRLRALDVGNEQGARTILPLDVDGDAEVDVFAVDAGGLAILLDECGVHPRELFRRFDDGPRDDVRERRFRLAVERQVIVDDAPVFFERFDRDGADGGRSGHRQRLLHVLGDLACCAAKGNGVRRSLWRGDRDGTRRGRGSRELGVGGRRSGVFLLFRLVIVKKLAPARAHRVRIAPIFLVELLDECDVGAVSRCHR